VEATVRRGRRRKQLLYDLKEKDTEILRRKHYIALCGEPALKEAIDLS
jgi:hypothetical protein